MGDDNMDTDDFLSKPARVVRKLFGFASGIAVGTVLVLGYGKGLARSAAEEVVGPVKSELHYHLGTVSQAMSPGGVMYEFRERATARDEYLVEAVAALCAANPRAPCPSPAKLVHK